MVTPRLRLERLLGEGGMGSVWVAEHLGLGTRVAVKFISGDLAEKHPELTTRFANEAAAAARITSPHVVRTLDFGAMDDGTSFLVMELLDGEALEARLARTTIVAADEVAVIVRNVANALDEAHRLGIVHRDIKPANVFLARSGGDVFAKVLDFGIAKDVEASAGAGPTQTGTLLGTPAYMSPEQLMSAKGATYQADLWALAVTAYEMLFGERPFVGETVASLIVAIHGGHFAAPSSRRTQLPAGPLDGFFSRAFARSIDQRFGSALELADALQSAVRDAGSSRTAHGPTAPGRPTTSAMADVPEHSASLPTAPGTAVAHRPSPPAGQAGRKAGVPIVAIVAGAVGLAAVGGGIVWGTRTPAHDAPTVALPVAKPQVVDGSEPQQAPRESGSAAPKVVPDTSTLAPEDSGFVDKSDGWGWSDRCWKNIGANKLDFAKAECAEGMKLAKADGSPESARPSLLYNLGMIEERTGNASGARSLYQQSLDLRWNDEVAGAARRVGGSPSRSCVPCRTQEDFDDAGRKHTKCCPGNVCESDKQCSAGRVCCKIPNGQLCADESRCGGVNRVSSGPPSKEATCRASCPGTPVELTHCFCVCMGDCPE